MKNPELIIPISCTVGIMLIIYLIIHFSCPSGNITTIEKTYRACFYYWQLNFECSQLNGTLIPSVENDTAMWSCSKLNYTVPAC